MSTKIEWVRNADGSKGEAWNCVRGCSRVSEGCRNCYAMRMARRFSGPGKPYEGLTCTTEHGVDWQIMVDGKLAKMPELDGRVWDEQPEVPQ